MELKAGYKPTPSEQARIAAAQEKAAVGAKEWASRKMHEEAHALCMSLSPSHSSSPSHPSCLSFLG